MFRALLYVMSLLTFAVLRLVLNYLVFPEVPRVQLGCLDISYIQLEIKSRIHYIPL